MIKIKSMSTQPFMLDNFNSMKPSDAYMRQ